MLNLQGQSILMDFGIAKIVGGKQHTATGAVVGTAFYMAPEIIRGEMADHRVDIYSLGVTLFETLTGKRPFEANSAMSILMMHVNDPVPDASQINPDVPPALVAAVVRAMAKDKNERYQTAAEFAAALRAANLSQTTDAKPIENIAPPDLSGTIIEEAPLTGAEAMGGTMIEDAPPVESPKIAGTMIEEAPPAESLKMSGTMIDEVPFSESLKVAAPASVASTIKPGPPPTKPPATATAKKPKGGLPLKWIGIGAVGVILIGALAFFGLGGFSASEPTATPTMEPTATTEPTATSEPTATLTPEPSATSEPTATLEPTEIPTATLPPGPQVRINSIMLDGSTYVVEYETFEYTEVLPGMHVHFYFNNFTQEQVGSGGGGSWFLYGGPRPFRGFTTNNRPASATQMCAIVANPNHTIILDTGNCVDLP